MIEDLAELAAAAATDIAIDKTAKRHRWVRVLRIIGGLLFVALVAALIYVTFKYS